MLIEDPTHPTPNTGELHEDRIAKRAPSRTGSDYRRPKVDVLSLSCEISAYAPDEDGTPLF